MISERCGAKNYVQVKPADVPAIRRRPCDDSRPLRCRCAVALSLARRAPCLTFFHRVGAHRREGRLGIVAQASRSMSRVTGVTVACSGSFTARWSGIRSVVGEPLYISEQSIMPYSAWSDRARTRVLGSCFNAIAWYRRGCAMYRKILSRRIAVVARAAEHRRSTLSEWIGPSAQSRRVAMSFGESERS